MRHSRRQFCDITAERKLQTRPLEQAFDLVTVAGQGNKRGPGKPGSIDTVMLPGHIQLDALQGLDDIGKVVIQPEIRNVECVEPSCCR
jgi:hypothetical protein